MRERRGHTNVPRTCVNKECQTHARTKGPNTSVNKGGFADTYLKMLVVSSSRRLVVSAWLELEPDTVDLLEEFGRQDLVDDAVGGVALVESAGGGEGEDGYRHGGARRGRRWTGCWSDCCLRRERRTRMRFGVG